MEKKLLGFLDSGRLHTGNDQLQIGNSLRESTPLAKKRDRLHALMARFLKSPEDIA
jgi:hypothetical protein